jgi:hypothetical protein
MNDIMTYLEIIRDDINNLSPEQKRMLQAWAAKLLEVTNVLEIEHVMLQKENFISYGGKMN